METDQTKGGTDQTPKNESEAESGHKSNGMENLSDDQIGAINNSLNSVSFKVKPILLEFQNYHYHHTSAPEGEEKIQERFVGREKIINKLLSYIQESTSNTGAYLITGFRGMGKTLVVNKALATLNPNSKTLSFFSYWVFFMPVVIFWTNIQGVFKNLIKDYPVFLWLIGALFLAFIFVLGYQDPRNERIYDADMGKDNGDKKIAKKRFYYLWRGIKYGLVGILDPKFERSKHTFSRNLRFTGLFFGIFFGFVLTDYFIFKNSLSRHEAFWLFNHFLIYAFLVLSIYNERLDFLKFKVSQESGKKVVDNKTTLFLEKLLCLTVIIITTILSFYTGKILVDNIESVMDYRTRLMALHGFIFLGFLSLLYLYAKLIWKRKRLQKTANVYDTAMSKFRTLFDFQHHIVVRVNLGKDNLSEKEVLKFIANELYREYSQWYYNIKSIKRLANVFLLSFMVYAVAAGFYNGFLDTRFSDFSRNTLKLGRYFPSQHLIGKHDLKLAHLEKLFSNDYEGDVLEDYLKNINELNGDSINMPIGYKELMATLIFEDSISKANMVLKKWYPYIPKDSLRTNYPNMAYSFWESFHLSTTKVFNELDYLTLKLWNSARKIFLSTYFEHLPSKKFWLIKDIGNRVYPKVPVLSIYLLMFFLVVIFWSVPNKFRFVKGHGYTLNELKKIKNQIDASITFEQSGNASSFNTSWFNFRKQLSYQPLDAKDISQKLIHLLDDVHSLPFIFTKAKFVVVFDELDKISPLVTTDLSFDKDEDQDSDGTNGRYETRRKERISRILSSMKHFFNSAKAKFIFIAGREMYDAALAGISDRESSLDSIFNENKIYVNSFYTEIDDNNLSDLTSITEKYLCQFLIPSYYLTRSGHQSNLMVYREFLYDYFDSKQEISLAKESFGRMKKLLKSKILDFLKVDNSNIDTSKGSEKIIVLNQEFFGINKKVLSSKISTFSNVEQTTPGSKKVPKHSTTNDPKIKVKSENIIVVNQDFLGINKKVLRSKILDFLNVDQSSKKSENNTTANEEIEVKVDKIITVLKDFIVYLTYRSNGAPKKLSNLLEKYLVPIKDKEFKNGDVLYVGNTDENLYLEIGYYNQYKVTLTSYLTTPIFLGLGKYMHEYSDKLLVSISYMLDHLYKFHKSGISFRSLSLTPEIVDVDKEPQFREFLDKLVHSLSKNHLRPIVSGMYDYKFNGDITSEISFLSKIDELEAAAFNFTLDESIELKRHFSRRLEQMMGLNAAPVSVNVGKEVNDNHINAQSLLNVMLGDLHFYDEEYYEAITHYLESIQVLRQKDVEQMNLYDFVILVRNKLKLALAFEKNKMYDNALMTYSEITDAVLRKRSIPLKKFGLARFAIKRKDLNSFKHADKVVNYGLLYEVGKNWYSDPSNRSKELIVVGRLKQERLKEMASITNDRFGGYQWNMIFPISDMETFYRHDVKKLVDELEHIGINQHPLKLYFLQSTLENIRVLYQPIIAKLYLIEKSGSEKLKDIDVRRAIDEFNFLKMPLKTKEKRVVVSEFYNKIGDLLYFKNGTLNISLKKQLIQQIEEKGDLEKEARNLLIAPIDAVFCYVKALAILLIPCHEDNEKAKNKKIKLEEFYKYGSQGSPEKNESFLMDFLDSVKENLDKIPSELDAMLNNDSIRHRYSHEYLCAIANCVVDLADALSGFVKKESKKKSKGSDKKNSMILQFLGKDEKEVLEWYYKAYELYYTLEEYRLAKAQLLKIVYSISEGQLEWVESASNNVMKFDGLCNVCIKLIYKTYDDSHYMEIEKLKEFIGPNSVNSSENSVYRNSIAMAEIAEIVNLYQVKKYNKIKKESGWSLEKGKEFYKYVYRNINPYSVVRRKQDRISELNLRLTANKDLYENWAALNTEKEFLEELGFDKSDVDNENMDWLRYFLILDSLGACNELLKTMYLLGIDYVVTCNLMLAKAHKRMAFWCSELNAHPKDLNINKLLREKVLNSETLMHLSEVYHLNLALQANNNARGFHSRGETLNTFLKDTSYLDDFFNDNQVHYLIAYERKEMQKLQWKVGKKEYPVKVIEDRLKNSPVKEIYETTTYFR